MPRITQYQPKAEVRPTSGHNSWAERTTPDKYQGVEYLPFGNQIAKAGALAVLCATTALAFVPVLTPTVKADQWHPAIEQPVRVARNQYLAPSYFGPERQPQPRLDSWLPAVEQPLFDKKRAQYEYPSAFAPESQPQPRLDSWYQQASEPVRTGPDKRVRWLGDSDLQLTAAQEPERATPDKWAPLGNQPQFDRKRTQHTYEWSSYDPQPFPDKIYADRWWQQPNQPLFDQKRNQYLYPSYFGPDQQPKPRLDSWWQQASEPVRLGPDKRVQWLGASILGVPPAEDVEEITPDRWQPLANQPQFDIARRQYLYPSYFGPERQPDVRVSSWWQLPNQPIFPADRRIQGQGESKLQLSTGQFLERVSADKWHPATEQPLFDKKRTQYSYEFSFFSPKPFPSPIFADKWHPESNLPVFPKDRRVQVFGDSELTLAANQEPERVSADKWHPAVEQPLFQRQSRAHLVDNQKAPFTPVQVVTVTVDRWFQQPSEPVRFAPSCRHLQDFSVQGNGAAERVSADKWHPLVSQPIFDVKRAQYLYPSYFGPERQPDVRTDSWHPAIAQPLFDLHRKQHLYPTSFAPERQPQPRLDSWFQPASEPVRLPDRHVQDEGATVLGLTPAEDIERVSADKWHPLPNQPLFDVRRLQYLYPSEFAPKQRFDFFFSADKWHPAIEQPLFDRRRQQFGYPSAFFHPQPFPTTVYADSWWQLPNQPLFAIARLQYHYPLFALNAYPIAWHPGWISTGLIAQSAHSTAIINGSATSIAFSQTATSKAFTTATETVVTAASATSTIRLIPNN